MYLGIFFVAFTTLMYEILLTRIFSVTMWFHFAFVAISIAMFGMTVGAIVVYLLPRTFTQERAPTHLTLSSLILAVTIAASFIAHLYTPFITKPSLKNLFFIALTYSAISVPFVFSGIAVCLALTKFPREVGRLYAADLAGASLGCLAIVWVLGMIDAPSAVFVTAAFAGAAAACFVGAGWSKRLFKISILCALFFICFAGFHAARFNRQSPLLRLLWVKGSIEKPPFYEKWNSFSRVTVSDDPNGPEAFGWGLSSRYHSDRAPEELMLKIDSGAATPITRFDGDLGKLRHLKHDVINIGHYLRQNAEVLVVGTGGGRDVLSALVFDQKSVLGVEINRAILDAVNQKYGDFSGHLDKNPKVRFINDEARSTVARLKEKFDFIQVSFIDTSAATAAGAFVFTENSLYTVEAWKIFFKHLKPHGILSFSRWYYLDLSGEVYRLAAVARTALQEIGVSNPREHILVVKNIAKSKDIADVGTLLVSPDPFTPTTMATLSKVCAEMNFEIVLEPNHSRDASLETIVWGPEKAAKNFIKNFPINISATTDDNPFYFSMVRVRDFFNRNLWAYKLVTFNMKAVFILGGLLVIVSVLTFGCILIPLFLTTQKKELDGSVSLFIFFFAIGLGFMFVEISQMQRLVIFLGHPIYGLSAVLFTLLLSSSMGSFSVGRMGDGAITTGAGAGRLAVLLAVVALFGAATPFAASFFQSAVTPIRILVSAGILFPLGFFMGMAFPLGMKMASARSFFLTPWLWGINGAASVLASVLAAVIALNWGISASFWTGFLCYVVAFLSFVRLGEARRVPISS